MSKISKKSIRSIACSMILLCMYSNSHAQPDLTLSTADLLSWQPSAQTPQNISHVALSPRRVRPNYQIITGLDTNTRVLYSPDGMDNFGPYIDSAQQFNLFNFSHWSSIDLLAWFGGSAGTPVIIPSKAWVDAAHRNGVKVIGTIFMAPAAYGGSETKVQEFLQKDANGRFIAVTRLKQIAEYYHFDGWIMNFETRVSSTTGALASAFVDSFHSNYSGELIWYDAMLQNGYVSYQNMLNANNGYFFERSSGLFTNYNWSSANTVTSSANYATGLGESPFKIYTGADMWPNRNAQPAFSDYSWIDQVISNNVAKTSLALFATNFTFNYDGFTHFNTDPADYNSFYTAERKIFAGIDQDPFVTDNNAWKGLDHYIPVRTTLTSFPFETDFNTGHGLNYYHEGAVLTAGPWHNMSHQAILPSWTFYSNGVTIGYDFEHAYNGGSSLHIASSAAGSYNIPLFSSVLTTAAQHLASELVIQSQDNTVDSVAIALQKKDGTFSTAMFHPAHTGQWEKLAATQPASGLADTFISIHLKVYASGAFDLNIGNMSVEQSTPSGIAGNREHPSLRVFPNPSSGTVYFNSAVAGHLNIYDLHGRLVISRQISTQTEAVTLPACGVYIYELTTGKGFMRDKLIVK